MPQETEQQVAKRPRNDEPLNNLGRVIQRRKELNISQEKIGEILGVSRQAWSKREKQYFETIEKSSGKFSYEYNFTPEEMERLNCLLNFPKTGALSPLNSPMVFGEREILETAFEHAVNRDSILVRDILGRICDMDEADLQVLRYTADVFKLQSLMETSPYMYEQSLVLLSGIRNAVSRSIRMIIPDDKAWERMYQQNLEKAKIWAEKANKRRIEKQFWKECKKEFEELARTDEKRALEETKRKFKEEILEILGEEQNKKQMYYYYLRKRVEDLVSRELSKYVTTSIKLVLQSFLDGKLE